MRDRYERALVSVKIFENHATVIAVSTPLLKNFDSISSKGDKMKLDILQDFELFHDDLVVFDKNESVTLPCEMPTS